MRTVHEATMLKFLDELISKHNLENEVRIIEKKIYLGYFSQEDIKNISESY